MRVVGLFRDSRQAAVSRLQRTPARLATLLLVAAMGTLSCRHAALTGVKPAQDNVSLTGLWHVTTSRGDTKEMPLVQLGDAFTGQMDTGKVTGTIHGNLVTIELEGGSTRGTGVLNGNFMEGEYVTSEEGQSGRWEAKRDQVP
jgi:hypothetical protein